ncbi:MAG: helix-turn-helix domain-containing protein [Hormoscilla sp. GM7CHS1pb]|nr:helix-turn-helix domain-containing protein [Hormoscilla sp. GM7CHS1pb]
MVSAYINGEGTFRQIARRFNICLSSVYRIIKQFFNFGRLAHLPIGGGPKPKLDSYKELIFKYLEECNDLTLSQLCERLEKDTLLKVSVATSVLEKTQYHTQKENYICSQSPNR